MPLASFTSAFWWLGSLAALSLLATYGLYPALMAVLSKLRSSPWKLDDAHYPEVTMVVAAYNEAAVIRQKVENFLAIDYPADKLSLIVGSDGSSDDTDSILAGYADGRRINAVALPRGGKPKAINRLMGMVRSPIVVFSDANTLFQRDSIRLLTRHFADAHVGGVCGNSILLPVGGSIAGESEHRYWVLENLLKQWEGSVATTLGATGGMYAIRRELYEAQPEEGQLAEDLLLPLRIVSKGYRFVYESAAMSTEETSPSLGDEFRRKVRVGLCSYMTFPHILRLHLPARIQCMLFFHKYLRWLSPLLLLLLAIAGFGLRQVPLVRLFLLYPIIAFVLLAIPGFIADMAGRKLGVLSMPYYFIATNAALLYAWVKLPFYSGVSVWDHGRRGTD